MNVQVADIASVPAPVAVMGRYLNTPADGAMATFDDRLDGWLQTAIERGIIGSLLGELAFIPIPESARKKVPCEAVVIGGMGEFGTFTRDDLRYMMSNVALSVRLLGFDRFTTVLIGTGNQGLSLDRSVHGILEGILEAFDHFPASYSPKLEVTICIRDSQRARKVHQELKLVEKMAKSNADSDQVEVGPLIPQSRSEASKKETRQGGKARTNANRITITLKDDPALKDRSLADKTSPIEYAALTSTAVVPVRTQMVQTYFLNRLPARLMATVLEVDQQEQLGQILTQYLVPHDFHTLIHGDESLILVLDNTTAAIPWEMACFKKFDHSRYYGTELNLTRQFRTVRTVAPGIAPPVNGFLNVLIVADPAGGRYHLDGARKEAQAVLDVLAEAKKTWKEALQIRVTVRVGSIDPDQNKCQVPLPVVPKELGEPNERCDPLDILGLLLTESYDVIHFAGHGVFEPATGRMGWVFGEDCILSATEILKMRRVPRLVFGNACHSAEVTSSTSPEAMVGLAEAFFQQGIENYIGTGWAVNDDLAVPFAAEFYRAALGVENQKPNTLSEAAGIARALIRSLKPQSTSWGAYQYYGQPDAKLIELGSSK